MKIERYGVLAYEPQALAAGLKILTGVIDHAVAVTNLRLADLLRPALQKAGLVGADASEYECAERAADLSGEAAAELAVPEEQLFTIEARPYEKLGRVPGTLEEFAALYAELAASGDIAVTMFNTASTAAADDFRRLAETIDQFPAMIGSTWVVTSSLREPVPAPFMARVTQRRGGRPAGKAGKYLAVTEGLPHIVPIGDSIVMVTLKECQTVLLDRLRHLRKWGNAGTKKWDGLGWLASWEGGTGEEVP